LLVAIVAAIALTMRERKDTKAQNPGEQVKVKAKDRLRMVKMEPVHQALVPPPAEEPKP
jgi:NADH-quinone oxidoreductase subunit J